MRTTVNQLFAEQQAIQQGHLQLQKGEFFPGAFQRAVYERVVRYPLHCVYYNTGGINKRTNQITLFIIVADRVYKDYGNLNDTKSDTKQCVEDIVDIMTHSRRWNRIGRVESAPVTLFIDGKADEVTGHMATVTLTLFDRKALCDLPMLDYDFEGSLGSSCAAVTVTDSDGTTIVEVPSGGAFSCTPITPFEPVTIHNSDNSYSVSADSGDDVSLPDVTVSLGNGDQTFPSVQDIDLSNYIPNAPVSVVNSDLSYDQSVDPGDTLNLPDIIITTGSGNLVYPAVQNVNIPNYYALIKPTGTRTPVNTVNDPSTQVAWYGGGGSVTTGSGFVQKTAGGGAWNTNKLFPIATNFDFRLEFSFATDGAMAGFSFIDISPNFSTLDFCIYYYGGGYIIYQTGEAALQTYDPTLHPCKIEFIGSNIMYYVNNVLIFTQPIPSTIHSEMIFDCALLYVGSRIENILLTYL